MDTMSNIEFKRAKEGILKLISTFNDMTNDDDADSLDLGKAISAIETNLPKLKLSFDKSWELSSIISSYEREIKKRSPYAKNDKAILIKHSEFLNNFAREIEKIKITDTEIVENKMTWGEAVDQEITIVMQREPNLKIKIISPVSMDDLLGFKKNILRAIGGIKASPISKFYKAVKGNLIVGTDRDIKEQTGIEAPSSVSALFDYKTDDIIYFMDIAPMQPQRDIYSTLIHEFAHRFHHNHIKGGLRNPKIRTLYVQAFRSEEQCYLDQLPKIGDPLSNLRENWWSVKMASEEWILSEITDKSYIYKNYDGELKYLDKKDILRRITCPSQYGAKNEGEFFAEMCTLITLGLVKPSQKLIADKFMQIVEQESI
jgi:hypothetical protein